MHDSCQPGVHCLDCCANNLLVSQYRCNGCYLSFIRNAVSRSYTKCVSITIDQSPGVNTSMSGGKLSSPGYGTPIQPPVTRPGIEVLKDMCM